MKRLSVEVVLIGVVAFAAYAILGGARSTAGTEAAVKHYVVGVEGMSCPVSCAPNVKEALEGVAGVDQVEVSFEDKRAIVTMASGQSLSQEACDQAFGNSGYFVSSFEEKAGPDR